MNFFENLMKKITAEKILIGIAGFLFFIIIGTTAAVYSKPKKPVTIVKAQTQNPVENKLSSYKELGKMRAVTAPEKNADSGATVVISPLLSYTLDDEDFYEELARKNSQLKSIFINYYSGHTKSELKSKGEARVKAELLSQLNQILVLNKIQDIYFNDYVFLE